MSTRGLPRGFRVVGGIAVRTERPQSQGAALPCRQLAADLLPKIRKLARTHQWEGFYTYNALGPDSGLQGILVRETVIFADIKDEGEPLTAAQRHWQQTLKDAGQDVVTWYPSDWPAIEARLSQRKEA